MLTDTWGVVAFADGGMAHAGFTPKWTKGMLWGAGLGIRYNTIIGPLRVDLAAPLNRRSDDGKFQLYISIGQSF